MTRILVVEDEPGIAMALEDDLRSEGYEVEVVRDGATASRRACEETFDAVLLDIMLPRKDGFDVCRDVRRAGIRTPIIMLTAKNREAEKIVGLDTGADDYITKPYSPRELRARIRAILRRSAGEQPEVYRFHALRSAPTGAAGPDDAARNEGADVSHPESRPGADTTAAARPRLGPGSLCHRSCGRQPDHESA
jgi:DNA-binding response OmpR family regulator